MSTLSRWPRSHLIAVSWMSPDRRNTRMPTSSSWRSSSRSMLAVPTWRFAMRTHGRKSGKSARSKTICRAVPAQSCRERSEEHDCRGCGPRLCAGDWVECQMDIVENHSMEVDEEARIEESSKNGECRLCQPVVRESPGDKRIVVSGLDERDTPTSVLHERVEVLRYRGSCEVIRTACRILRRSSRR